MRSLSVSAWSIGFAWFIALGLPDIAAAEGYKVLHRFCAEQQCIRGELPIGGLTIDSTGNVYGTTEYGGKIVQGSCPLGCGIAFRRAPDGTVTVLHVFAGGSDGAWPAGGLLGDKNGNIYGVTQIGGAAGCGGLGCAPYSW